MRQQFWRRWSKEYLSTLQNRTKWSQQGSARLMPGSLVLLMDTTAPLTWKRGRVTELHPGKDGVTRVVSVRVDHKIVKRALVADGPSNIIQNKWIILIYARNHALHFGEHESNVENFVKYILEDTFRECRNQFHQRVFEKMLEQNQIQLIWDGVDEASDATQNFILTLVTAFSEKRVKQWLTSRINLRDMLEKELEKIKTEGDDVGFISHVISKYDVEFIHNSYREYFAALYLFENEPSKAHLKLAENSKCLVGVIYKNLTILKEFTDADLLKKDIIGRDILEVACAWNKSYPLVKNNIILNGGSFKREWLISNNKKVVEALNYRGIAPEFYKFTASHHLCFKKLMILLPFLIPLYDGNQFAEEYLVAVLYYAIRFDCPVIYECIENSIPLKTTYNNISSRSILALALFSRSAQILKKVLSEKRFCSEWDCVEELLILNSDIDEVLTFALHLPEFRTNVPNSSGQSLSHYACENNLTKTLRSLILRETKMNIRSRNGKLPIHLELEKGHSDCLKHIAQTYVLDKDGRLPLHYACEDGDLGVTEILLTNGAKVDIPDGDGRLPIHYACKHGTLNLVELLVTNGAKFDVPDRGGQLPMHYACRNGRWGRDLILFLCKKDAKVNVSDGDGRLPIHYACKHGRLNLVELLVTNGSKFDVPDRGGQLPMHYAYRNDRWGCGIILFLCKKGAKVDVPDGDGQLPIHYACKHGTLNLVELLVTNGSKFDVRDRGGQLPMHYACRNNWWGYNIMLFLCKKGAKVDVPDGDGQLSIHYACQRRDLNMVELLATNGAIFDVPDRGGQLPMHYACRNVVWGSDIILFLCKKGAKVDVPDGDGQLPIHYACKQGTLNMVKLLVMNGAKFDVRDRGGQLPMHHACRNYDAGNDIILFLLEKGAKVNVPDGHGRL
ncbi:serine/threonine-protein phosphatase 6 regulatory ankyrin repeat subunit C-like [Zophobas morio]|uniref:serine/threonine-protein phosphatase 6 regulatory ankyrin repeat subunit C-like n=1 Tax=Zophobas morio TaxID=2755281 RepID=UPI003082AD46